VNTTLSTSQEAQMEQYRIFARERVAPIAQLLETRQSSLKELLSAAGQKGYMGLSVPKEYGGSSLPFLDVVLFTEQLAYFEPGLGLSLASHTAVIELLKKYGSDNQKSRYLPLLARGECIGAVAFNEAKAGTDFEATETVVSVKDGKSTISGSKTWVVNGDICGLIVVLAKSAEGALAIYLVDASAAKTMVISADKPKLGMRSQSTNDIQFSEHVLPGESTLSAGNSTVHEQVLFAMDIAKVVMSGAAVGLSEGALECAAEYARTREQFGQSIGNLQAIQWKLADISLDSRASRLLTYRAAWSKDNDAAAFRKNAAMAKAMSARTARLQSAEALQVMGAEGISADSPLERFYRDSKVMEIVEGTSEYQKVLLTKELGI
jgi:alkylation response protein AidB-like acyl-CoA dehydrogenase